MISKQQVISLLKFNGIEPTAPEHEVKAVLLSARYSQDEVIEAFQALRGNKDPLTQEFTSGQRVLRSDDSLKPKEISELLGVDVHIREAIMSEFPEQEYSLIQYILIFAGTLLVSAAGAFIYMYVNEVGAFHSTSVFTNVFADEL